MDLGAYFGRLGTGPAESADLETLRSLHEAHLSAIPFENLDVRLGRPVGLDLESLQAKMVRRRRGGYCFEQNALFAEVLRALGYRVQTLEARVRPEGAAAPLPRTHMTLRVDLDGRAWLADVGFGGDGPVWPVLLDGTESEQPGGPAYRVAVEDDGVHALQHRRLGTWRDLYAFTLAPALPVDYQVAHHFTSTYPRSPFVNTLTVQRSVPGTRWILRGCTFTERRGDEETVTELSPEAVPTLLRDRFGLDVTDEEVGRALAPVHL